MRLRVIRCNGNKILRKSFKYNISLWLPVGIWMGTVFWLSAQQSLPNVPGLCAVDWGDKICHTVMYVIGGALIWRALDMKSGWQRIMVAVAFAAAYGLSDEVHQYFVPNRSSDIYDLLCDVTGSAFAAVVLTLINGGFNYAKRTKGRTDLRSQGQEAD